MAKSITTRHAMKAVVMLGMLVIILVGIKAAEEIIVPFILALFIAVILNPLIQRLERGHIPRAIAISLVITIIIFAMLLLLASLGSSLNELARTLPQYRYYLLTPLQNVEPWLQRAGLSVSIDELIKYIDPNALMAMITRMLTQLLSLIHI